MASGVAAFPSNFNTYVQDTEATGNLRIEYSRNPKDFSINKYCQIIPVSKQTGLYWDITAEEAARVLTTGENAWPDGAPRPMGAGETESFRTKDYRAMRKAFDCPIGFATADQASWDIAAQHMRIQAARAMTNRTIAVVTAMTTTGNYSAAHTADAASIGGAGGTWAASTTTTLNIKRGLMYAVNQIQKSTLGAVKVSDMNLVVSPELAAVMSESGEISDYVKNSPYSGPVIEGKWGSIENRGLPEYLYGVRVVIEDAVKTTSRRGATAAKSFVLGNATAVLCSRVGGLEGTEGPTFSSIGLFAYREEDMLVEKVPDPINKRFIVSVVDTVDAQMLAPASAFLFTTCQ